ARGCRGRLPEEPRVARTLAPRRLAGREHLARAARCGPGPVAAGAAVQPDARAPAVGRADGWGLLALVQRRRVPVENRAPARALPARRRSAQPGVRLPAAA